jgi:acetoin utilization deacetylase AcuC-like enzyme
LPIAARYAQRHHRFQRIAIVDFDIHHGNGAQMRFMVMPTSCLFRAILHRFIHLVAIASKSAAGAGHGTTLNIPVQRQSDDVAYLAAYQHVVIPALQHFQPDCLLISAGYDAHWDDPVGNCALSVTGYAPAHAIID